MKHNFSINIARRKDLLSAITHKYPDIKKGAVLLFGGLEPKTPHRFRQETSFYYMTGIKEPGTVMVMDLQGATQLYVPNCATERAKWVNSAVELTQKNAANLGFSSIKELGAVCPGYTFYHFFPRAEYQALLEHLEALVRDGGTIFTLIPNNAHEYVEQRFLLERLKNFVPDVAKHLVDISPLIAAMRRKKDMGEIESLYKAVEITTVSP